MLYFIKIFREIIINFVKSSRKPLRNNPQIYNHATFIRSRNTTMDDMQAFAKSLEIKKDSNDKSDESMLSLQHWYPRVWDDWARSKDGAEADEIYVPVIVLGELFYGAENSARVKENLKQVEELSRSVIN